MNMSSDLKQIEQAVTRIRNCRGKLLGQALEIRKAVQLIQDSGVAENVGPAISILEDAAALIECELHRGSQD